MHFHRALLVTLCLGPAAVAQITATYGTFGTGCPGTGAGLGNGHIGPAIAATSFGSGNAIPLGWTPNLYQQLFLASDLPTPCTLAALRLRCANQPVYVAAYAVDMDIKIGYTTRTLQTLSPTYASNWDAGAPLTVLPRTQVAIPDFVQPTSLGDFRVTIPWTTPFAWTPTPGLNLLVEMTIYGNSWGNQIYGYPFDNVSGTCQVWGTPATATSGQVRSFGMAMQFVEQTNTAVPSLYSTSTPQIGNTFRVRIAQAKPSSFALLLLGLSNSWWNGVPLPFDLGVAGAPGCPLLAAADNLQVVLLNSTGYGSLQYTLPNNIYLLNLPFYNQALVADAPANALGIAVSNAGVGLVGNQ